jgi:hypothetical protein
LTHEDFGFRRHEGLGGRTAVNRNEGSDRRREDEDLARLKFAASTAQEAALWLRNSLARIQAGHEVESEIQNAERALQAALEGILGVDAPQGEAARQVADENRTD